MLGIGGGGRVIRRGGRWHFVLCFPLLDPADSEIKVPVAQHPDLSKVPIFKTGHDQNIAVPHLEKISCDTL